MATSPISRLEVHWSARRRAAELRAETRALQETARAMRERSALLLAHLARLHRRSALLHPLGLCRGASDRGLPPREAIWLKLCRGELPWTRFQAMLVGRGGPGICAGCDGRIAKGQVRIEAEFTGDRCLLFHADCFGGWHSALTAREQSDSRRTAIPRPSR